jgi:Fe-S oxidoreductase
LHTLANEYPAFGGNYEVIHHTQLIDELLENGRLTIESDTDHSFAFHDPCYLGRQNNIIDEPRQVLSRTQNNLVELSRNGKKSFCCGAGGAQMWKEEAEGDERVSTERFKEAQESNADILAVGCPFCMVMLNDAKNETDSNMEILDIAEIIVQGQGKSGNKK